MKTNLPVAKTLSLTFSQLKEIASANKTAKYNINVFDEIDINDKVRAKIIKIGRNYIKFVTIDKVDLCNTPVKKCELPDGNYFSYGSAAMYENPRVTFEDARNTVCYYGSDLQTNIYKWLSRQSKDFKNSIKKTTVFYKMSVLKKTASGYTQKGKARRFMANEKVYIPSQKEVDKLHKMGILNNGWFYTSTPYDFKDYADKCNAFGSFYNASKTVNRTTGQNPDGAIVMFSIG